MCCCVSEGSAFSRERLCRPPSCTHSFILHAASQSLLRDTLVVSYWTCQSHARTRVCTQTLAHAQELPPRHSWLMLIRCYITSSTHYSGPSMSHISCSGVCRATSASNLENSQRVDLCLCGEMQVQICIQPNQRMNQRRQKLWTWKRKKRGKGRLYKVCRFGARTQQGVQTPYKKTPLCVWDIFLEHLSGFGKNKLKKLILLNSQQSWNASLMFPKFVLFISHLQKGLNMREQLRK